MEASTQQVSANGTIKVLITESNFYLDTNNSEAPSGSSGEYLEVHLPSGSDDQPTLVLHNKEGKPIEFNTINGKYSCQAISPLTLFITFDVELTIEDEPHQWHFELLTQRLPARLCCNPNNKRLRSNFSFYVLDGRFDDKDASCGQTHHKSFDGSGGGLDIV